MTLRTISPQAAQALLAQGAVLVDIRAADERARMRIEGLAINPSWRALPRDFIKMAWLEFRDRIAPTKRYKDWRQTFRNYIRGNYLQLWWQDGEDWALTTAGKQAWTKHMKGEQ